MKCKLFFIVSVFISAQCCAMHSNTTVCSTNNTNNIYRIALAADSRKEILRQLLQLANYDSRTLGNNHADNYYAKKRFFRIKNKILTQLEKQEILQQ